MLRLCFESWSLWLYGPCHCTHKSVSNLWLSSGNMLTFMVGQKQAFEVSLADVSQTQLQGKNDVILEFHVDDTTGANEVGWLTCVA